MIEVASIIFSCITCAAVGYVAGYHTQCSCKVEEAPEAVQDVVEDPERILVDREVLMTLYAQAESCETQAFEVRKTVQEAIEG